MKKYELTEEVNKHGLHRIRALRDIKLNQVKKGDLGGFVDGEWNLAQTGECWIADNAEVYGNQTISGSAVISGRQKVHGEATVHGNASIEDEAEVYGYQLVTDYQSVNNGQKVHGFAVLNNTLVACAFEDIKE